MKNYSRITFEGTDVPHKTVRGLSIAIQHKKQKDGLYKFYCPGGNIHTYEMITKTHTAAGRTVRKSKVGKGASIPNTKAKLIKVERA